MGHLQMRVNRAIRPTAVHPPKVWGLPERSFVPNEVKFESCSKNFPSFAMADVNSGTLIFNLSRLSRFGASCFGPVTTIEVCRHMS